MESQSFDSAKAAFDAGWGPSGNNRSEEINTDFGYSDTNNISGNGPGEAGGRFSRIFTEFAFYGDLSIGEWTLEDPLRAEGKARFDYLGPDTSIKSINGEVIVGFFDATDSIFDIVDRSGDHLGFGILEDERARTTIAFADGDAPHDFNFASFEYGVANDFVIEWDPNDPRAFGEGALHMTITNPEGESTTKTKFLKPTERITGAEFNAFGVMTSFRNESDRIELAANFFVDDVTYTSDNQCVTQQCKDRVLDPPPNGGGGTADIPIIAGDSDLNGAFDTADIVVALAGNKFETGNPATWQEGDWNAAPDPAFTYASADTGGGTPPQGNGVFDTSDIVAALAGGNFEKGTVLVAALAAGGTYGPDVQLNYVPEPSTVILFALGLVGLVGCGWRGWA